MTVKCIPEDIDIELLNGYGGLFCILNMDTGQMYSHTKRKENISVFCNISENGKLYENDSSAIRAAKRISDINPKLRLCVTYYGIALTTYFHACLILKGSEL